MQQNNFLSINFYHNCLNYLWVEKQKNERKNERKKGRKKERKKEEDILGRLPLVACFENLGTFH